jgi:Mn2+/Fe2+ NRAMP family transporter
MSPVWLWLCGIADFRGLQSLRDDPQMADARAVCVGTAVVVRIPWQEVGLGLVWPHFTSDGGLWTTVVAIMGTTISPYLVFWQASQEVEDIRAVQERQPLTRKPGQAPDAFKRIRVDTWLDMAFSNLVAVTIMITTATTLHRTGVTVGWLATAVMGACVLGVTATIVSGDRIGK